MHLPILLNTHPFPKMTIVFGTLTFLLVSFGVATLAGHLMAFGMGSDRDDEDLDNF